jgi:hypothetical protein
MKQSLRLVFSVLGVDRELVAWLKKAYEEA